MAKKRVVTTTEEHLEGIDSEETPPEKLDDDVIRALVELEGSDEITWTVTRVSEPNSGFCGEMSTVELSKRRIAEAYGPGRYRVLGRKPDGSYYKSGRIAIATPTTPASDKNSDLLESLKGKMNDNGMLPLLLAMIQNNGQIVAAALAKPESKSEIPWTALLAATPAALVAVKEFFKNDTDSQSMEKLLKQLTILEKLRGDDSKGSSWQDIIRDGLQTLRGMGPVPGPKLQPVSARAVMATPDMVSGTQPFPVVFHETPEAIEPTQENLTMDWLRKKLDELLQNAAQNKNPELRAELLLDDLPPFIPESLIKSMLMREDWFEQLCSFDSRVLSYHGWFSELRECIVETLSPDGVSNDERPERANNTERNDSKKSEVTGES